MADRIKAVLLYDKGWTYQKIAEALILDEETISQHVEDYRETQKLKPENGGSQSKLTAAQSEELLRHLYPMQMKNRIFTFEISPPIRRFKKPCVACVLCTVFKA